MTVAAAKLPPRTGGTTMGATAFLPVRNCQRPHCAHTISGQPAPPAPHAATAARFGHETDTKTTRFLHGFYMVSTRFSPPSSCTTPAHTSACAAGKNIVSPQRSGSAERTHHASPPCLLQICQTNARPGERLFMFHVFSRLPTKRTQIRNPQSHKRTHCPALHFHAFRYYVIQ